MTDVANVSEPGVAAARKEIPSRRWSAALRWLRRIHLYSGLLLFPWILFFGVSGLLFNHPNVGEDVSSQRLSAERLRELTGLSRWEPQAMASDLVRSLNAA